MFEPLFKDERVGRETSHYPAEWEKLSADFLNYAVELEAHIPYVDVALGEKLLKRSMVEYYYNNGPGQLLADQT